MVGPRSSSPSRALLSSLSDPRQVEQWGWDETGRAGSLQNWHSSFPLLLCFIRRSSGTLFCLSCRLLERHDDGRLADPLHSRCRFRSTRNSSGRGSCAIPVELESRTCPIVSAEPADALGLWRLYRPFDSRLCPYQPVSCRGTGCSKRIGAQRESLYRCVLGNPGSASVRIRRSGASRAVVAETRLSHPDISLRCTDTSIRISCASLAA